VTALDSQPPLFTRFWVLCLLEGATRAGLAPAGRPQLFALAYLANAVADSFQADAIQRAVLRDSSGPALADVAIEVDRLAGLGLCNVTRVVSTEKTAALKSQFISEEGEAELDRACDASIYLGSVREFHRLVAAGFSDLGIPLLVDASKAEASYSDLSVGEDEIVDLGEFANLYPTLEAIRVVQGAMPSFRDGSPFGTIQVYGRFLRLAVSQAQVESKEAN
jgi:hypothetical protein